MAPEAVAAEAVAPEAVAAALAPDVMSVVQSQPGVPKPDPILTADRLVRSFGAFKAVDIETIEIQRGVITALIGPNGAGKTTFFNLATGFDDTDEGSCWFQNRRITGMNNYQIARLGAVRTFQNTRALTRLTVMENMLFASQRQFGERLHRVYGARWRHREWSEKKRAEELLDRFALAHMADEFAGTLSGGQRKLLEMARALMAEPTLVLLDEPLAGVNPALGETILETHLDSQGKRHDCAVHRTRHVGCAQGQRLGGLHGRRASDSRGNPRRSRAEPACAGCLSRKHARGYGNAR